MVHWDWTDPTMGSKYEMVALIEDNFIRSTDVSSPTINILQFLFACVCFHYKHLDAHMHKKHHLRAPQTLLLLVEQNIFTSLILQDVPGRARPTLPTQLEYLHMSC